VITYIIRRLIHGFFIIIIVTVLVFSMMRMLPGDPITLFLSESEMEEITPEQIAVLKHKYGLDKPLIMQYIDWISHVARGDLGTSMISDTPVIEDLARVLPRTLHLGLTAFLISIIVGITVGVISAVRRGTWWDTVLTILANLGITVPIFWMGILLIYIFGYYLDLLPIYGYTSPFKDFWLSTKQSIMPIFCLSIIPIASGARLTRSTMLEVIRQDYIRTAWAKGLRERTVIIRHTLKNALLPVIIFKGMTFRHIFGGSVLIETVFNIPGMGRLTVDAIFNHDYPIVQSVLLFMAIIVVFVNLIIDFSYGWLDPRTRYE